MTQIDTSLFTPQREATHRVATHRGVALHPPGSPEPSELRFREAALARHGTIHHGIAHVTTETSEDFQNRKNPWISAVSQSSGLHLCKKTQTKHRKKRNRGHGRSSWSNCWPWKKSTRGRHGRHVSTRLSRSMDYTLHGLTDSKSQTRLCRSPRAKW